MAQSRLLAPFRVLEPGFTPSILSTHLSQPHSLQRTIIASKPSISSTSLLPLSHVRHASHAAQGAANKHAQRPAGKRLGAKRTNGEYVVPGCIIFRQRGTKWFPGENCGMGRDHTIFASERGYVRYYLDPERHPDRKFIGISFEKDGKLPTPKNAPTKRRLNKVLAPRLADKFATEPGAVVAGEPTGPQLRPGYMYREGNWQIGRAAEKAGIEVPAYKRDNRWLAWRRRKARHERTAQLKSLRGKSKKGGKKKKGKGRR